MLTFVRGGPRVLIVRARSGEWDEFLQGKTPGDSLFDAGRAGHRRRRPDGLSLHRGRGGGSPIARILLSDRGGRSFVSRSQREANSCGRIIPVPRMIVFRYFGDYRKIFDQMLAEFQGVRGKLRHVMRKSSDLGAAVCFTAKNP